MNLNNHRRTFVDGCELLDGWPQVGRRPGNDTGRYPPLHLRHGDLLLRRSSDMGLYSGPSSVAAATIAPCHCRHRVSKQCPPRWLRHLHTRCPSATTNTSTRNLTQRAHAPPCLVQLALVISTDTRTRARDDAALVGALCSMRGCNRPVVGRGQSVREAKLEPREITQLANYSLVKQEWL